MAHVRRATILPPTGQGSEEEEEIYISGLPDGLMPLFESGVSEIRGRSRSWKVRRPLGEAVKGAEGRKALLDERRFVKDVLRTEQEVQEVRERLTSF